MSFGEIALVVMVALWLYLMGLRYLGKVAPGQAKRLVEGGALLVDVRTPSEYQAGHLPGARNLPLQELEQRTHSLGKQDSAIVVYCASGARSHAAKALLKRKGFTQVYDLGSLRRWQNGAA